MKAGDSYSFYQVVKALRRVGNDNGTPVFNRFIDDEVVTKRVSGLGRWSSAKLWDGERPVFGVNYNLF